MAKALKLAQLGRFTTHPNPNVGCVIVKDNKIVGEGFHYRVGESHAEVNALKMAGKKAIGATAYVTLEPCSHHGHTSPCCDALIIAGISKVIYAMQDPNPQVSGQGFYRLKKAGIEVSYGLMMDEAEHLNQGFLKRMRTGLPYVQLKIGASLDGRTALANGQSQWITSSHSRRDVQRLRAQSHAILTSSTTVLNDNPLLNVRWDDFNSDIKKIYPKKNIRQPLRIIIDRFNRVTPEHLIVRQKGNTCFARLHKDNRKWPANVNQIIVPEYNGCLDLKKMMLIFGSKQINSILIESGPTLSGMFLKSGLVDELIVYLAPKLLGSDAKELCLLTGFKTLSEVLKFSFSKIRQIGPDICLHLIHCK